MIYLFLFFALSIHLYARGAPQIHLLELKTQNDDWILCITDFDVSTLPEDKTNIADVVSKYFVNRLSEISYRFRISPEYTYYEDHAWARERSAAAKALSLKLDERSAQMYTGDPNWRYQRNITKLDSEIETLRVKLERVDSTAPFINKRPMFNLTGGNINLIFPAPPQAGTERRFCNEQKADAFLTGSITDFHGRYYLTLKLYTLYTRSFIWEDNILFSHNDLETILEEIILRMNIVLSGNRPSAVAVTAEPDDTLILINKTFAGRGNVELTEYPPRMITISASALNHDNLTFETELLPGEASMVSIRLNPIEYGELEILGGSETRVYHGSLYVGEAPLTLRLPINHMDYIQVETSNQRGTVIYQTPDSADFSNSMSIRLRTPPKKGHVDRARRHYYWAWGGTWIAAVSAWVCYYTFMNIDAAIRYDSYTYGEYDPGFYNQYTKAYDYHRYTLIAVGAVSVYGVYRLIRYIHASNKDSTPTVTGRN